MSPEWPKPSANFRDCSGHCETSTDHRAIRSCREPLSRKEKLPIIPSGNPHSCRKTLMTPLQRCHFGGFVKNTGHLVELDGINDVHERSSVEQVAGVSGEQLGYAPLLSPIQRRSVWANQHVRQLPERA